MNKTIKNIGLDVHKKSISIGIADDGRDGEVRYYGKIDNDMNQLDKVIRKYRKELCYVLFTKLVLVDNEIGVYDHRTGHGNGLIFVS